ncbi:MAG: restriction endonuclease subunit S, partial [Burkholderiales bacterium]|nr:restriction endonuclease subunit S [Burkholderiales bacterium]
MPGGRLLPQGRGRVAFDSAVGGQSPSRRTPRRVRACAFRSTSNRFVFYCFQSHLIKRQIHEHLGATINQITNASLGSFRIPFPPPPERERI